MKKADNLEVSAFFHILLRQVIREVLFTKHQHVFLLE